MSTRLIGIALVAVLGLGSPLHGQTDDKQAPPPRPQRMGRGNPGRAAGQPSLTPEQRTLQRQIQQAFRAKVRDEVGLTDEQMEKVQPIIRKYDSQRMALNQQDRATRAAMAAELAKPQPDEAKIQQYTEQERAIGKQRFDVNDARQRELGTTMTPVQLAKFRSLEEKLNQQMLQVRRGATEAQKAPPPP